MGLVDDVDVVVVKLESVGDSPGGVCADVGVADFRSRREGLMESLLESVDELGNLDPLDVDEGVFNGTIRKLDVLLDLEKPISILLHGGETDVAAVEAVIHGEGA